MGLLLELTTSLLHSESDIVAYEQALTLLKEMIGFSSCSIHLLEDSNESMYLIASRDIPDSIPEHILQAIATESMGSSYMKPLLDKRPYRPIEIDNEASDLGAISADSIFQGEMVKIPLMSGHALIGALTVIKADADASWFVVESEWLRVIGEHLGSLIDERRKRSLNRSAIRLQEQDWLTRELNTQLLDYLNAMRLIAQHAHTAWEEGDQESVGRLLEDMDDTLDETMQEVRIDLKGVQDAQSAGESLVNRVRDFLARFQKQWGLSVAFSLFDPAGLVDRTPLPLAHLFRILQESLTNTRLHAHASHVEVSLEREGGLFRMLIIDDGCGFDVDAVPPTKVGLRIMDERATEVGGRFNVISSPGEGTIVRFELRDNIGALPFRSCTPQGDVSL